MPNGDGQPSAPRVTPARPSVTGGSPLISVVIALHNGASWIEEAMTSVREQDHQPVELIVVDDGSSDGGERVARSLVPDRLTVLPDNRGPSVARNVGIAQASGDYITFLDADDVMLPGRLSRQLRHLLANPADNAVMGGQVIDVEPGVVMPAWLRANTEALAHPPPLQITTMVRTRTVVEVGGFTPALRLSEDMEWLFRMERCGGGIAVIEDPLVRRRIHGSNATYQTESMHRGLLRSIRMVRPDARRPLVSVVVPAHNSAGYIGEALESVLAQELEGELQLIVIDDGSTDGTAEVARSRAPGAEVLSQPRLGPGAARNHGVLLSRGRYVAFLDADDVWLPGKLAGQLGVLESGSPPDLVFGLAEEFLSPELGGALPGSRAPRPIMPAHLPSALLIRRTALARAGLFPVQPGHPEWMEWYARAREHGLSMEALDQVVVRRRLHRGNHTLAGDVPLTSYLSVVRGARRRRRSKSPPAQLPPVTGS